MGIYSYAKYATEYGVGAVIASEVGVLEVILPFGVGSEAVLLEDILRRYREVSDNGGFAGLAARELQDYFSCRRTAFTASLDRRGFSPFACRVCDQVAAIGYGKVLTYGAVAAAVGAPNAARAVGAVMAANRLPIIIPCHRILAADGAMRGYSAAGGVATKKLLLQMEGVKLSSSGLVQLHA